MGVKPKEMVDATRTLVNAYKTLGPMERERTGGLVEKAWRFKCRGAVRSVLGKVKGMAGWEEMYSGEVKELDEMMEGLSKGGTES